MHKIGVGCALHFLGKGELHESGLDEIPGVFRTSATADFRNPKEKISRGLPQFCGSPFPTSSLFTLHSSLFTSPSPPVCRALRLACGRPLVGTLRTPSSTAAYRLSPYFGCIRLWCVHSIIRFRSSSFSFEQGGTKEKEAKRKCRKGDAQEGTFYKKSPLDSLKNFYTAYAMLSLCAPN